MITKIEGRRILDMDALASMQALTSVDAHQSRSGKYAQIPTIEIIRELTEHGWHPVEATQARVTKDHRMGFQKHMVRMANPDLVSGEEMVDLILLNSHDGTSSYQVRAGVYRLVCENGLVVGTDFMGINVRHVGFTPEEVIDASFTVAKSAGEIAGAIDELKAIELTEKEKFLFGSSAAELLFEENVRPDPAELVRNRLRREDNEPTLWKTFNTTQENWAKGLTRYRRKKDNRLVKSRTPQSIDGVVRLNQALWTLTRGMATLKQEA